MFTITNWQFVCGMMQSFSCPGNQRSGRAPEMRHGTQLVVFADQRPTMGRGPEDGLDNMFIAQ